MDESSVLDLPVTKELSRTLVSEFVEKNGNLDIDKLLLENNFQYVSLDDLSYEVSSLKQAMEQALLDEINENYPEYMEICDKFDTSKDNEVLNKLRQVLVDLQQFTKQLNQLVDVNVQNSKEKITTTLAYLKSLDQLLARLDHITTLSESLKISQQLLTSLQSMMSLDIDNELLVTMATQLSTILVRCDYRFKHLQENESPLVCRLRNEFKSILEISKPLVIPIIEKHSNATQEISSEDS